MTSHLEGAPFLVPAPETPEPVITALPFAAVVAPVLGAVVVRLAPEGSIRWLGAVAAGATAASAGALTMAVARQGTVESVAGAVTVGSDGHSAILLGMTALVGLVISAQVTAGDFGSGTGEPAPRTFWSQWLLLWAALNTYYVAGDLLTIYAAFLLLLGAATGLIQGGGTQEAREAARRYLLTGFAGSVLYLAGTLVVLGHAGTVAFNGLDDAAPAFAVMLATAGLLLKVGLFPLHSWLPAAHGHAPAPVSPILSGVVGKASFYVVLRLWFDVTAEAPTYAAAQVVGVLAGVGVLWASVAALGQNRLKLLIAYSTVAQIGYFFLLVPLAAGSHEWRWAAWDGGIYLALAHGLAKAALFAAAGTYVSVSRSDRLEDVAQAAGRLPVTSFAVGVAAVSLVGLPPSGGFVGKWYLTLASVGSGQGWWLLPVLGGGLLTGLYLLRVVRLPFTATATEADASVPRTVEFCTLTLALGALLIGLRAVEPLNLLGDVPGFVDP